MGIFHSKNKNYSNEKENQKNFLCLNILINDTIRFSIYKKTNTNKNICDQINIWDDRCRSIMTFNAEAYFEDIATMMYIKMLEEIKTEPNAKIELASRCYILTENEVLYTKDNINKILPIFAKSIRYLKQIKSFY